MKKILKNLPPQIKKEIELLRQEYREQITPEARFNKTIFNKIPQILRKKYK